MTKTAAAERTAQRRSQRGSKERSQPAAARQLVAGSSFGRRLRSPLLAALVIAAAGLFAYSNSFRGVLVFDDIASIVSNPHIKSVWPLSSSMSAPRDVTVAGRPLASLSLAVNYALAPLDARDVFKPAGPDGPSEDDERFYRNIWGYHALNLAVHVLAALALFGVVRRTLIVASRDSGSPLPSDAKSAGGLHGQSAATAIACAVALIWVVHPLHTEAVTYIVQRTESLMGLFYLLTLYCAIRASDGGRWWTVGAIGACALGMGSKEAMVTAPIAVALWDWTFTRTRWRWPLYAALCATWLVLVALAAANPRAHSAGFGLGGWTWWTSLQTQAGVVVHYLRLAVVPHPLVFDYEWPMAPSVGAVAPQALLLVALLSLTVYAVVRRNPLGFAAAWFFLVLAPTSSVLPIPTEVAAEHRMYLPVAAIISIAVAGLAHGFARVGWQPRGGPGLGRARAWLPVVTVVAVATVFGTLTYARNRDYWSDEALMRDTVEKRPLNLRARVAYGADLVATRRFADAEAQLRVAARLPGSDKAHAQASMYLGSALCAQGKTDEGIAHLQQALALDPTMGEVHALLGEAYDSRGMAALAVRHFALALDTLPDNAAILRRAAWLLATASDSAVRDGGRALEFAERAVRTTGRRDVLSLEALMAAYAEQDRFVEAANAGREALALAQASGNAMFVNALRREVALCETGQKLRDR